MPVEGAGGGAATVKKRKPVVTAPSVDLISEHGKGGGYSPGDTGTVPTAAAPAGAGGGTASSPPDQQDRQSQSAATGGYTGPVDWAALLGEYGMPSDVVTELDRIFRTAGDINQAITLGQAYVRGTPWYTTVYPGIQDGINAGLFSDEQGYRSYHNDLNQLYQQYYGRNALATEVAQYTKAGQSVSRVAAQFNAGAIYGTLQDPLRALFTDDELHMIANEQAGLDTKDGAVLNAQANLALKVNSLYQDFFGRTVTRDELAQLFKNGATAQDVAKQFATAENINAMSPVVKTLFSADEIHQIALDAAGGVTQNGQQLANLAKLADQLNPLYSQYTGQGISRDELNQLYSSGQTVDQTHQKLAGAAWAQANRQDVQQAAGSFGDNGQLTNTDLQTLGEQEAGYDTPAGQNVLAALNRATQRMQGVFKGALATPAVQNLTGAEKPTSPDVAA